MGSSVFDTKTLFIKEKAGITGRFCCCNFCLSYDGSNKSGDGFYDSVAFSFAEKSGRILAVSHIFVLAPTSKLKVASFKLAGVIGDGSISVNHNSNSFLYRAAGQFPGCQRFLFISVL